MATYIIGDVHGCYYELILLLKQINFTPGKDLLWLTGDLIGRGYNSLEVLRYVKSLGSSARIVLGNHELRLLSINTNIDHNLTEDCIVRVLKAPDVNNLINWLRHQPLLQVDKEKKIVMSHAGIIPQWNLGTAVNYARDLESILISDSYQSFLKEIYFNISNIRYKNVNRLAHLCINLNAFTRMRYCSSNGQLDMYYKGKPENAPRSLKPWFFYPSKVVSEKYSIVFGHWASLEGKGTPENIYALDTGCCWNGKLTCLRWEDKVYFTQLYMQQSSKLIRTINDYEI